MNKSIFSVILAFALLFLLTACAVGTMRNAPPATAGKDGEEQPFLPPRMDAFTEPETKVPTGPETEVPTGPETEAPTGPETEAPTGPETEAPTGPETEAPTGPETEAPTGPWQLVIPDPTAFGGYDATPADWFDGTTWQGFEDLPYKRPTWPMLQQDVLGKYGADCIFKESTDKVITLTFDCGYYYKYIDSILDTLKDKSVHATFFLVMDFVDEAPETVQRMIDEGHTIGNHTDGHVILPEVSIEKQIEELVMAHERMQNEFGYTMRVMRFPNGRYSERSLAVVHAMGYRTSFWSFAYRDFYVDDQPAPEAALETMLGRIHPGAIYLLHDCSSTNDAVLGEFIDRARALGYSFTDGYPI